MERSLGLVIPAYRPDRGILADYVAALDERLSPATIRIELDAPRPGVVDALAEGPATVSVSERRRGKGAAITAGFEALDTDVLAFADADGSTPAGSMADVVAPVLAGDAALAVGSRRHPDSSVRSHQTLVRRRLGDAFAATARRLLEAQLYDYQCGAKALSADAWAAVRGLLYEPGFAWDVELIAMVAAGGRPIVEVPIVWEDQPGSTVSPLRTSLELGRTLVLARHRSKLQAEDPLHAAIDRLFGGRPALIDRPGADR
ncbi:MAG: glycosyltransferase [Halobacteriales archaeon]|nr:glycosyltransferase [Halobacteriales archaeon]